MALGQIQEGSDMDFRTKLADFRKEIAKFENEGKEINTNMKTQLNLGVESVFNIRDVNKKHFREMCAKILVKNGLDPTNKEVKRKLKERSEAPYQFAQGLDALRAKREKIENQLDDLEKHIADAKIDRGPLVGKSQAEINQIAQGLKEELIKTQDNEYESAKEFADAMTAFEEDVRTWPKTETREEPDVEIDDTMKQTDIATKKLLKKEVFAEKAEPTPEEPAKKYSREEIKTREEALSKAQTKKIAPPAEAKELTPEQKKEIVIFNRLLNSKDMTPELRKDLISVGRQEKDFSEIKRTHEIFRDVLSNAHTPILQLVAMEEDFSLVSEAFEKREAMPDISDLTLKQLEKRINESHNDIANAKYEILNLSGKSQGRSKSIDLITHILETSMKIRQYDYQHKEMRAKLWANYLDSYAEEIKQRKDHIILPGDENEIKNIKPFLNTSIEDIIKNDRKIILKDNPRFTAAIRKSAKKVRVDATFEARDQQRKELKENVKKARTLVEMQIIPDKASGKSYIVMSGSAKNVHEVKELLPTIDWQRRKDKQGNVRFTVDTDLAPNIFRYIQELENEK